MKALAYFGVYLVQRANCWTKVTSILRRKMNVNWAFVDFLVNWAFVDFLGNEVSVPLAKTGTPKLTTFHISGTFGPKTFIS